MYKELEIEIEENGTDLKGSVSSSIPASLG